MGITLIKRTKLERVLKMGKNVGTSNSKLKTNTCQIDKSLALQTFTILFEP